MRRLSSPPEATFEIGPGSSARSEEKLRITWSPPSGPGSRSVISNSTTGFAEAEIAQVRHRGRGDTSPSRSSDGRVDACRPHATAARASSQLLFDHVGLLEEALESPPPCASAASPNVSTESRSSPYFRLRSARSARRCSTCSSSGDRGRGRQSTRPISVLNSESDSASSDREIGKVAQRRVDS